MNYIKNLVDVLFGRKGKGFRQRILAMMMAIVVFCTTYMLMLPAITLDRLTADIEPGIEAETAAEETLGVVQDGEGRVCFCSGCRRV